MFKVIGPAMAVLAVGLFFWGCNSSDSGPTSPATPKWIGTWVGNKSVDTLGMTVSVYVKMALNADMTFKDSSYIHMVQTAINMTTRITEAGTFRDMGNNKLETTNTACTEDGVAAPCSSVKDTVDASGINGNTWTITEEDISVTLTKQ